MNTTFILKFLILLTFFTTISCNSKDKSYFEQKEQQTSKSNKTRSNNSEKFLVPKILKIYPHDSKAYTQGLFYDNGYLYESTGLYGQSSLRKVDILTGNVLQRKSILPTYFAEGITKFGNNIYQLTWENKKGFIYDFNSFEKTGEFIYPTEGWGITTDNKSLIVSDGSNFLTFYNPTSFEIENTISVQEGMQSVMNLNELEYVNGKIYANVYMTDDIVVINPISGNVESKIDVSSLRMQLDNPNIAEVANGIAYNPETKTFYLTGKYWSNLFEVTFEER
jgi:glutamine cyclotransferase